MNFPLVTVQLPTRNEIFVAEGLLEAISKLDYPKEKLEIQILDDSNDTTTDLLNRLRQKYVAEGFKMEMHHRNSPRGFKAGALADGMKSANGEYFAIFDADARPSPDFLKKVIALFSLDPKLGMIQGRFLYRNNKSSILERIQSTVLDGLMEEQKRLSLKKLPFQFNGTGGIWRRTCIEEAGGWNESTVAEDLHLSIRAQLKGWRFQHLSDVGVEMELTTSLRAFRNQQFRWVQGSTQCLRLLGTQILASELPLSHKSVLILRLIRRPLIHFCLVMFGLLLPLYYFHPKYLTAGTALMGIFVFASGFHYLPGLFRSRWPQSLHIFVYSILIYTGLSPNALFAFFSGLFGRDVCFYRTPKLGNYILPKHFAYYGLASLMLIH